MINPTKPYRPFIILPRYSIYGDYQILFDLYTNFDFRTYVEPDPIKDKVPSESHLIEHLSSEDLEIEGDNVYMMID